MGGEWGSLIFEGTSAGPLKFLMVWNLDICLHRVACELIFVWNTNNFVKYTLDKCPLYRTRLVQLLPYGETVNTTIQIPNFGKHHLKWPSNRRVKTK
jgi:hypothetical protein